MKEAGWSRWLKLNQLIHAHELNQCQYKLPEFGFPRCENRPWMGPDNVASFGGFGGPIETGRPAHKRVRVLADGSIGGQGQQEKFVNRMFLAECI